MGFQEWWPAPTLGEAPSLPPDQLNDRQARKLTNYLVHHPGRIVPRGRLGGALASDYGALLDTTNGGCLLGHQVYDDKIGITYRQPAATPLVDNWRVPLNRPTNAADLAQPSLGATGGRVVDVNTGATTNIAVAAATSIPGVSTCRVGDAVYAATFGGASTAVPTGVAPLNCVHKTDFAAISLALLNGPRFVQAVIEHAGRVWVAAARSPGGADYDTSLIFYTNPGGTTAATDVVADWTDPVTGELNFFSIGAANDGDFVVGFGRANGQLIIFKRNSVWALYGTHPSNFTLRQLRTQSGCVDLRSIVVADEGTYFASQLGYESFDGNRFTLLSEAVSDIWLPISNAGVGAVTVNHAFIRGSAVSNNYLYVCLGTEANTASAVNGTTRGWLLHRATGAWTDIKTAMDSLNGGVGSAGYVNRFIMTRGHLIAFGAPVWARADELPYGPSATGVYDADSGAQYDVELTWTTRLSNLSSYRSLDGRWQTFSLVHSTIDFHQEWVAAASGAAWSTLAAVDGSGGAIVTPRNVLGYDATAPLRARPMYDTGEELPRGDVSFTVTGTQGHLTARRIASLSVYGLGCLFDHGRHRAVA